MAVKRMSKTFDTKAYERHEPQAEGAYEVTFEGAVLDTYERNGYHDSDFFAVVWDDEQQTVRSVAYATTSGWTYPNSAVVDATEETLAKARAWAAEDLFKNRLARARAEARFPLVGRKVRVIKKKGGRYPVAVGEEGYVAAVQDGRAFDAWTAKYGRVVKTVALQLGDRMAYIGADRVEVLDPEQFEDDEADIRTRAYADAERMTATGVAQLYRSGVYQVMHDIDREFGWGLTQKGG